MTGIKMLGQTTQLILAAGLVGCITVLLYRHRKNIKRNRDAKNVPGSPGWPILGHLTYLNPVNPYPMINYYTSKYGPVFRLQLGSWNGVVFTDYQQIKRLYSNPDFNFRPRVFVLDLVSLGFHGLISSDGPLWAEHRRFALRHLRDLGMGKSSIEMHIQREVTEVMENLTQSTGKPIALDFSLNIAITNIVWAIVAGERMEYDNPRFLEFVKAVNRNMEVATQFGALGFVSWLPKLFPSWLLGTTVLYDAIADFYKYTKDLIVEHKERLDSNDPRDYIDHFLIEQKKQGTNSTFTETQLMASIGDLFAAGGETTGTTLRWAVLLISSHPEVQKKLQEEIDLMIGKERLASIEDQKNMPYTLAVINEVLRFGDIGSMNFLHSNQTDAEVEGYYIHKDSMIIACVSHCHRNSKYWAKPYEFYPEHFLDANGQVRHNVEGFLPFSIGKRACIGESLARAELFIFIIAFFQRFNFRLADHPKPSLEADPRSALIRWPCPYKVILAKREP